MKKSSKILIIVLVILAVVYFGYKGFNLFYYNVNSITAEDFETFVNHFNISNTITIKHKDIQPNDYFEYQNIKIRNDFKDFEILQESSNNVSPKLVLKDDSNNVTNAFWMGSADTFVLYILKTDETSYGTEEIRITNENLTDILEKNNINNDIELFNYLSDQKYVKNNIFTSVKKMKENYAIQYMLSVIGTTANITLIDGDYTGYILNFGNMKEVSILKNDKRYVFSFMGETSLTDEYLTDILSTIVIEQIDK